jgi:A/G-specific adenine glycosylase
MASDSPASPPISGSASDWDPDRRAELRGRLLGWFASEARELPWRRTSDPYAIWVSETMLQQTRTATVIDYYRRFLAALPTVESLARADDDQLLALWSGLGYYSRARNLRAAADRIAREYGGRFPRHRHEALGLPGVGRYTAGAVLSIAYDLPEPLVDGNVARVFARLFQLTAPSGSPQLERQLWALAAELVPVQGRGPEGPGAWNQALMELGAVVCTPREPRCLLCPVANLCSGRRAGVERQLPQPKVRRRPFAVELECLVVRDGDRVLLQRRAAEGRMAGLWEPPTRELAADLAPAGGRLWPRQYLLPEFEAGEDLGWLRHTITVHRIAVRVRRGELFLPGGALPTDLPLAYVPVADLPSAPLTGLARKILRRHL